MRCDLQEVTLVDKCAWIESEEKSSEISIRVGCVHTLLCTSCSIDVHWRSLAMVSHSAPPSCREHISIFLLSSTR